jgi:hypothetical protein
MLEETTGLAPGDSFKILDITLPQDNLTKKDRSTDWAISTAIRDTFDGTNTSPVIRSAYWTAKGNLKGRDLISAGVPYRITAHNLGASITLEGAPVLAGAFSIMAKSPFETGIQKTHSLHSDDGTVYGHIEPNTRLRLTPRNLGGNSGKDQIKDSQAMIDRYLHFRFQKYFGSLIRLNRFRKTAKLINQQWDQKLLRREDIQTVTTDLNLPLEAFGQ